MIVAEKRFEYKDFPCVILFMPAGYRCGYVGILKENVWWIGFDCGHCFDGADSEKAKELYKDNENVLKQIEIMEHTGWFEILKEYPVRSLEYCIEECKGIVNQILNSKSCE